VGPDRRAERLLPAAGSLPPFARAADRPGHGRAPLDRGQPARPRHGPSLQVVFVTLLLVVAAWQLVRRRDATAVDWLLLCTAATFWIVSMAQANVGLYRTAATLVTLVPLVARFPPGSWRPPAPAPWV
jgi:hypothetical protein